MGGGVWAGGGLGRLGDPLFAAIFAGLAWTGVAAAVAGLASAQPDREALRHRFAELRGD